MPRPMDVDLYHSDKVTVTAEREWITDDPMRGRRTPTVARVYATMWVEPGDRLSMIDLMRIREDIDEALEVMKRNEL